MLNTRDEEDVLMKGVRVAKTELVDEDRTLNIATITRNLNLVCVLHQ